MSLLNLIIYYFFSFFLAPEKTEVANDVIADLEKRKY